VAAIVVSAVRDNWEKCCVYAAPDVNGGVVSVPLKSMLKKTS